MSVFWPGVVALALVDMAIISVAFFVQRRWLSYATDPFRGIERNFQLSIAIMVAAVSNMAAAVVIRLT